MSFNRRKLRIINSVAVNIGCSCRRPRLADIFRPKPKPKSKPDQQQQQQKRVLSKGTARSSSSTCYYNTNTYTNSSSSSWGKATTSLDDDDDDEEEGNDSYTTFDTPSYSEPESDPSSSKQGIQMCGKVGESLAVVKDSNDPYLDFRHSMLQMILEKEIYSRDDLRELLDCFLSLNSPYHHEIIVRAFTEIWNGVFSVKQQQQQQLQQRQQQQWQRVRRKSREF